MKLEDELENIRLHLNNIFYSVQGEGKYMGVPTLFFRFNKCNILPKCSYCDTNFERCGIKSIDKMTTSIKNFIQNYPVRHICFTGGEPLLFNDDIIFLVNFIKDKLFFHNFYIKIETNGTCALNLPFSNVIYTVTPKVEYIDKYEFSKYWWDKQQGEIIFKFMIDVDEGKIFGNLSRIYNFMKEFKLFEFPIYLSPINKLHGTEYILANYSNLIKQLNKLGDHGFFKDVRLSGITIQLNKLFGWL